MSEVKMNLKPETLIEQTSSSGRGENEIKILEFTLNDFESNFVCSSIRSTT